MSKVSHLPKTIPTKEIAFSLEVVGSATGFKYSGSFTAMVPSTRDMSKIGLELARINDGVPLEFLDRSTASLNNAIAFLRVVLKDAPAWFVNSPEDKTEEGISYGMDTLDVNVPIEVFKKADDLISAWHKSLKGVPDESGDKKAKA